MKKVSLIILSAITLTTLKAQTSNNDVTKREIREEKRKEILEEKKVFLQEKLELDDLRMDSFWKIYMANEDEKQAQRAQYLNKEKIDYNSLTEDEANQLIQERFELAQIKIQRQEEFTNELRNVLTPIEILKLNDAEKEFKKKLLEELKNKDSGKKYNQKKMSDQEIKEMRMQNTPQSQSSQNNIQKYEPYK